MNWVSGNIGYLPMDPKDLTDDKFGMAKTFILCFFGAVVMKWVCMVFVVDRIDHLSFAGVLGELTSKNGLEPNAEGSNPFRSMFFNPNPVNTKGDHVDVLIGNHPKEEFISKFGVDDAETQLFIDIDER